MASHIVLTMQSPQTANETLSEQPVLGALNTPAISSTSPMPTRGTSVKLSVPLDTKPTTTTTRKILRRDSLDRREALLKGKEGSRQRRRWENDRLLNNPHAEPPLPQDWEIRPTYPVRRVPYFLAPLWDAAEFQRAIESHQKGRRNTRSSKRKQNAGIPGMSPFEEDAILISRDVRQRLKHARSAKGLLMDLEEDVRSFLVKWNEREIRLREEGLHDAPLSHTLPVRTKPKPVGNDSSALVTDNEEEVEDEEIVFVGRAGAITSDSPTRKRREEEENLLSEKLVCEGLESDKGAAFGRWLAHCIGRYYGLRTWSVTTSTNVAESFEDLGPQSNVDTLMGERVRQAYVGVDSRVRAWMGQGWETGRQFELPRPLWTTV
ncbi:hypothetical protein LTR64_002103 [Lithohypha guttulata]|uniref:uncharacterized protein n=1 Tax=Lithohypha guttulata TaxID=1690604 RepID=UPI002DDE4A60|nr:hypothetical protein LTR51_007961 [Lithohypha guttulata]